MIAHRSAPWCFAASCLLATLFATGALAQKESDPLLKLRIYESLLPGVSKSEAKGVTQPMYEFLGRQVDQRIECDNSAGTTAKDLFEFGKRLNSGELHLGMVSGIEYGWLREKYPKLKILAVVSYGEKDFPIHTQLFVHKDSPFNKVSDLKGKRLAVYKDTPLMDRIFLRKMLQEESSLPNEFLVKTAPFSTVKSAVVAVKEKDAECVVMNNETYTRLRSIVPNLAASLVELKGGPVYPAPVLVGSPEIVDALRKRKGLWTDLREHVLDLHNFPEGQECISYWRFQSFVAPDDDFQRKVDEITRKVPIKELLNLE